MRSRRASAVSDSWASRRLACAAGALCSLGTTSQFAGASLTSFAAADLIQAAPLVGTMWGIKYLGEFKGATRRVWGMIGAMYILYLAAVVFLIASTKEEAR